MKFFVKLTFLSFFVLSTVSAAEKVKVGFFEIPIMVKQDPATKAISGVFVELAQTAVEKAGFTPELSVYPTKRAIEMIVSHQIDIHVPGLDVQYNPPGGPNNLPKILPSKELIYVKTDFAFTMKNSPIVLSWADLKGKTVGITRGYPYIKELYERAKKGEFKLEEADSDRENVRKLSANRINIFLCEEKTGIGAIKEENLADKVHYNTAAPLFKQNVYFAFQNSARGKMLEGKISKVLAEMKKDGTFGKIMSKADQQSL